MDSDQNLDRNSGSTFLVVSGGGVQGKLIICSMLANAALSSFLQLQLLLRLPYFTTMETKKFRISLPQRNPPGLRCLATCLWETDHDQRLGYKQHELQFILAIFTSIKIYCNVPGQQPQSQSKFADGEFATWFSSWPCFC